MNTSVSWRIGFPGHVLLHSPPALVDTVWSLFGLGTVCLSAHRSPEPSLASILSFLHSEFCSMCLLLIGPFSIGLILAQASVVAYGQSASIVVAVYYSLVSPSHMLPVHSGITDV